jgi:hypothetical protein
LPLACAGVEALRAKFQETGDRLGRDANAGVPKSAKMALGADHIEDLVSFLSWPFQPHTLD